MENFTRRARLLKVLAVLFLMLALPLAWRFTSLSEWVNFETLVTWQESMKGHPAALFWVIGIYLAAGLVFFPTSILNVATVVTFGPILGNAYYSIRGFDRDENSNAIVWTCDLQGARKFRLSLH